MYRIKHKKTGKIFYFQFFGEKIKERLWYTPTIEACDFDYGSINDFISLDKPWEEIIYEELQKNLP